MNLRRTLLCVLVFCLSLHAASKKPPLPAQYNKWLNQDVVYIITDEERKAFLNLTADDEREKFIKDFWDVRNPTPGSSTNPFKEEHYKRIEYANSHFGKETNRPGWMTDMGRTWILFGKPISEHAFVGYSQIYPLELWSYDNSIRNPSLPGFFSVLFFIPGDIGDYVFYHPFLDGPMSLVRGSQFNSNADVYRFLQPLGGDVARASLTLVPSTPIDTQNYQPDLTSEMLISKIKNFSNDHWNVEQLRQRRNLRTQVSSHLLLPGKELRISTIALTDPSGGRWLDYSFPVDTEDIGTKGADGTYHVALHYRLSTQEGKLIIDDDLPAAYHSYDASGAFTPFQIAGRLPLVEGDFKLEVDIVNRQLNKTFKGEAAVTVPGKDHLLVAGPVLADTAAPVTNATAWTPFQYVGVQFHPLSSGSLAPQRPLRILYQLYAPGTEAYDLQFALANTSLREARAVSNEHIEASQFKNGTSLRSKSLDTASLPPGDYMCIIEMKSAAGAVLASANQRFRIAESVTDLPLYFASNPRQLASPGLVEYIRGLAELARGHSDAARAYLEVALARNPANVFGRQYLVQAYFREHQYESVSNLYFKSQPKDLDESPEVLAQIAISLWKSGNAEPARKLLARARDLYPNDPSLRVVRQMFDHQAHADARQ